MNDLAADVRALAEARATRIKALGQERGGRADRASHWADLTTVMLGSEFIARTLSGNPALLDKLDAAARPSDPKALRQQIDDLRGDREEIGRALRRIRQEQIILLGWRDLVGKAPLSEVLETLSTLADAAIDAALKCAHLELVNRFGQPIGENSGKPVQLTVLGLGKLGGRNRQYLHLKEPLDTHATSAPAFPALITHCGNNFGPYQFPDKLIPLMVIKRLAGQPMPIYGDGNNVRDWIHVSDHARALRTIAAEGTLGERYVIGASTQLSNLEVVKRICTHVDALEQAQLGESLIQFVADRPGHDQRYALDATKLATIGWAPRRDFDTALRATVQWYVDQRSWWQPLMSNRYGGERLGSKRRLQP